MKNVLQLSGSMEYLHPPPVYQNLSMDRLISCGSESARGSVRDPHTSDHWLLFNGPLFPSPDASETFSKSH